MDKRIDNIIQVMQPGMEEYADNALFHHWMDYACELDDIALVNYRGEDVTAYLNKRMAGYPSAHAKHHAATDIASTLESLIPEYKNVFKY